MSEDLLVEVDGSTLCVTFDRPDRRNAMTWSMYEGLYTACERADADETVRVMLVRGAGTEAFVAGTDIEQFSGVVSGEQGVEYEKRITQVVRRLNAVQVPTVAAISGPCVGAGLALASACDLRVATTSARFGIPIARTLGNCLSSDTHALLVEQLGSARTVDMLLRARILDAEEVASAGFISELCAPEELDPVVSTLLRQLRSHAPLTMWATKESLRRLRRGDPADDDIVHAVYGSADFREGVDSFAGKRRPNWTGH